MNTNATQYPVVALLAVALSFIFLRPFTARADTPAQTQKAIQAVCSRAAVSYQRRDLSGLIAMYAPNFTLTNVAGRKTNFRQSLAGIANLFARDNYKTTASCTASQVVTQGSQARVVLHWHYASRKLHASPAYTTTRDYQEQSLWKKTAAGWQEASADMVHDVVDYRR